MRGLIAALLLVLLALPFVFGDPWQLPRSSTPVEKSASVLPTLPGTRDNWFEIGRILIGTFAGASAALGSALWLQRRTRRNEQIAAGNFAMSTLVRQYNAFLNAKKTIEEELARCALERGIPREVIWQPTIHFMKTADLEFDFKSLTFLFEQGTPEFFQHLHTAEAITRELFGHLDRVSEVCLKKQEKLVDAKVTETEEVKLGKIREIMGPVLLQDLQTGIEMLEYHVTHDAAKYLIAGDSLFRALSKHFGPGVRLIRLSAAPPVQTASRT